MFIHSNKLRIDAAVRGKHLARAARYARSLQKQLQENPMIRRCSSTREEVSRLEKDYLSAVLNQAALPEVQAKMAQAYWNAAQTLAAARTALATHDRNISPAPSTLESAAGRDQLQEELSRCIDYAHALTELGAPASTPLSLPDGQGIESEIAAAICVRESAKLDSTVQAVVTHNQRYQDHVLERWRRVSIKGWGMEKVFNERGRPQSESTLSGGAIVWTYRNRESCQQVRFSPRGKLIAEASGRCAVQLGSAQPAR